MGKKKEKVINIEITLKDLLIYWWHHNNKDMYTLAELNTFKKLIKEDEEKILEVAVLSYIFEDGSNSKLLTAIRENKVEKFINSLPDITSLDDSDTKQYNHLERDFLGKILDTYLIKKQ